MHTIQKHFRLSYVVPPAVQQQQPPQKLKLPDGKISVVCRLSSFLSEDAHAHVGFADHGNVVGTIADGQTRRPGHTVDLDNVHHLIGNRQETKGKRQRREAKERGKGNMTKKRGEKRVRERVC